MSVLLGDKEFAKEAVQVSLAEPVAGMDLFTWGVAPICYNVLSEIKLDGRAEGEAGWIPAENQIVRITK